jgi:ribosomal-protein-alanine acetyltransferase
MSEKDRAMVAAPHAVEIPNGVDLERYRPSPEQPGQDLLFIGSFRHFPNVIAFRFLTEEVWPLVRREFPQARLTVVAGPDPMTYWRTAAGAAEPALDARVELLEFVRDVRPLYEHCNLVLAPTLVSAGTNIKVLEAMAMQRAVVSTPSGCAGLGLEHGRSVWIAGSAPLFAEGVRRLLRDASLRAGIAREARTLAERHFDWRQLGARQRRLWSELAPSAAVVRPAEPGDLDAIGAIQAASPEAAAWTPESYLRQGCLVAETDGQVTGFLAYRDLGGLENEILNLAVLPAFRRRGVGRALVEELLALARGPVFLEVRPSNSEARKLYEKMGFIQIGLRPGYYHTPSEDGIVMKFQKC